MLNQIKDFFINFFLFNQKFFFIEIIITITGIICIWLAAKEKSINYLFGIINVSLCCYIFFKNQLYGSLLLQLFFLIINIYGWYNWSSMNNKKKIEIKKLTKKMIFIYLFLSFSFIIIIYLYLNQIFYFINKILFFVVQYFSLGFIIDNFKPNILPFWDSCILVLSVLAMFLMNQKYIENWLIWIIINIISINVFIYKGMYIISVEYLLLIYLSFNGYFLWLSKFNNKLNK